MSASLRHRADQRRQIWPPEPGYFLLRLVKDGWRVPCRIIHDAEGWHAEVDGTHHPAHADPALAYMTDALWHGGLRISQADYNWAVATREQARATAPDHPSLHPRKPMDPRTLKPIVFIAR
jgi:hypothetical protein